jgi:hypothetical protein
MQPQQQPFTLQHLNTQGHFDQVHPRPAHGVVVFWEKRKPSGGWQVHRADSPLISQFLAAQQGQEDRYFTVNQFHHWRRVSLLSSLRTCYVDIDGCVDIDKALQLLIAARLPAPSQVVYSGRGMHLYWLIKPVPAKALPVWQLVQNKLIATLASIGADPVARDCTRVLRLCGTINSKNGAEVTAKVLTGKRWTLHQLSDAVLGERPEWKPSNKPRSARIRSLGAAREGRKYKGSIYHRWYLVYQDLMKIADWYFLGGIPEGHRDTWLFLASVSLSWFVPYDRIEEEIIKTAQMWTPGLTVKEARRTMRPIIRRAQAAMRGEKVVWNGIEVDPRYRFRRSTLYNWMQAIIPAELLPQLRAIIPDELRAQHKKEADAGRWDDHYTKTGVRVSNEDKRTTARQMRAKGMTYQEIATEMDMPLSTIARWCNKMLI